MRLLAVALAMLASVAAVSVQAAVVNFSFSFTNAAQPGAPSVVRGLILGLEDDATGLPSSVQVTDADFGVGEYINVNNPFGSFFTVSGGTITSYVFDSQGSLSDPPSQTCCTLLLANALVGFPGLRAALFDSPFGGPLPATSDLALDPYTGVPAPVPPPASILLLGSAMAGLGCAAWRLRRAGPNSLRQPTASPGPCKGGA